jgi:hypothetical protein
MERMICGYSDTQVLNYNKYYTEVWIKYVSLYRQFDSTNSDTIIDK